jgi:competence protein ComEC
MIGIATSISVLVGAGLGWWGAGAVAMAVVSVALLRQGRASIVGCVVVVIAALLGAWRVDQSEWQAPLPASVPGLDAAEVVTEPIRTGRFQHFVAMPRIGDGDEKTRLAQPICVSGEALPVVRLGNLVQLSGKLEAAIDASLDEQAYLKSRNCSGSLFAPTMKIVGSETGPQYLLSEVRERIGRVLRASAPGDAGVLLSGLVTGEDEELSPERKDEFVNSSTKHLTAVSGSNLALVAGIFAVVGGATFGRQRLVWQALTIAALWAYALISGAQSPSVRAAIVATAAILAFRFGRRPDIVTLVLIAAATMVLIDPRQIDSLGFRLSVAASLGLAIALPALLGHGRGAAAAGLIAATLAAQIATLPFLLPIFGTVSLLGLPANILVAPLVAIAMPIAVCAGLIGLVSPQLAEIVAAPAALAADATLAVIDRLGGSAGYFHVGIPPTPVMVIVSVACTAVIFVMSDEVGFGVDRVRIHLSAKWHTEIENGRTAIVRSRFAHLRTPRRSRR